jgi:uncharacterized membrane protein
MSTSRFRLLKWISAIGVSLTLIGLGGLSVAIRAYPDSNLLGGWGLILGPIYWIGLLISFVAVLFWIVVGLRWLWRRKMKHDA